MPPKKSKNQLRREKLKLKKQQEQKNGETAPKKGITTLDESKNITDNNQTTEDHEPQEMIFEAETIDEIFSNPEFANFKKVFRKFQVKDKTQPVIPDEDESKGKVIYSEDEDDKKLVNSNVDDGDDEEGYEDSEDSDSESKLSKRQLRRKYKIPLAILKAESANPQLVELMDADSPDPRLLIYLKSQPNIVPVPRHWSFKRGFLAGKRGVEKPPFELPKFILDTGILEMRNTTEEDSSTLKQRMRERVQPKMGQLDIDFNKLYDAFFKFQTKPSLLKFGEIYYEGLDNTDELNDFKLAQFRPGKLGPELRVALGMSDSMSEIPPWFDRIKMLGPPPSYPFMKIRDDGSIKFDNDEANIVNLGEPINNTQWGRLEPESDSEEEDDEEDEESGEDAEVQGDLEEYIPEQNDVPIQSIGDEFVKGARKGQPVGFTAPNEDEDDGRPKKLYTVLKETKLGQDTSLYGPESLAYDMGSGSAPGVGIKRPHKNGSESAQEQPPAKKRQPQAQPEKFRF